jgi:site-specific DNA-cytosine methylase
MPSHKRKLSATASSASSNATGARSEASSVDNAHLGSRDERICTGMAANPEHEGVSDIVDAVGTLKLRMPTNTRFEALPVGPQRLRALFQVLISSSSPADKGVLKTYILDKWAVDGCSFGSFCAGTDSPALVWQSFWLTIASYFDLSVVFKHAFAAEIEEEKQTFIKKVHVNCKALFKDVLDLKEPAAFDVLSGGMSPVPAVKTCCGGFPCDDASGLNPHSSSDANRNCVEANSLRTGAVFNGIVEYVKEHGDELEFLNLENVTALKNVPRDKVTRAITGPSNLDSIGHIMKTKLDFFFHCWDVDPRLWGSPQSRSRLWMLAMPFCKVERLGKSAAHAMLNDMMVSTTGFETSSIDEYLLCENDSLIEDFRQPLLATTDNSEHSSSENFNIARDAGGRMPVFRRATTRDQSKDKWPAAHAKAFDKAAADGKVLALHCRIVFSNASGTNDNKNNNNDDNDNNNNNNNNNTDNDNNNNDNNDNENNNDNNNTDNHHYWVIYGCGVLSVIAIGIYMLSNGGPGFVHARLGRGAAQDLPVPQHTDTTENRAALMSLV